MITLAGHTLHAVGLGSLVAALMVVMPLHKTSPPPMATTVPAVATDSQQRLSHGGWLVLLHLLDASCVVHHKSSRPRDPAQLTSAGYTSKLPPARMGLNPALALPLYGTWDACGTIYAWLSAVRKAFHVSATVSVRDVGLGSLATLFSQVRPNALIMLTINEG